MSKSSTDRDLQGVSATIAEQRRELRAAFNKRCGPTELEYRGLTITAENPDHPYHDAYEIHDQDGELVGAVERSDFGNADQWVRFFDYTIQDGFTAAVDRLRADVEWWWDA